jgi:hypothetical protein
MRQPVTVCGLTAVWHGTLSAAGGEVKAYEITPELAALLKKPLGESSQDDLDRLRVLMRQEIQKLAARAAMATKA